MSEPIVVRHALGSYPVYLGAGLLAELPQVLVKHCPARHTALITDTSVGRLYERWESGQEPRWSADGREHGPAFPPHEWATRLSVPPGEQHKTRDSWARLTDALLEQHFGRDSAIIALGGGVVGDLGGFVAATYQRGIPCVQVPTTLLAMLDASVGGKTGVDTPFGKNLIGAFHPPVAVVADPSLLRTLPEAEYRAGMAEAAKHALIADASYLEWMEANAARLLGRDMPTLEHLIRRSVEIKAAVVAEDEREAGPRSMLNAGHTVAHALEVVSGYALLHGEAVALGLVAECEMAEHEGLLPKGTRARIAALFAMLGLPARTAFRTNPVRVMQAMSRDKKNVGGELRFAIPTAVGSSGARDGRWTTGFSEEVITAGLGEIL